jgi:hypothetical protein
MYNKVRCEEEIDDDFFGIHRIKSVHNFRRRRRKKKGTL